MTTKKTSPKTQIKNPNKSGTMSRAETLPLVVAARQAFDYQNSLGNLEPSDSFDSWRRGQVKSCVGRDGLTDCDHIHFQPLLAHFQTLAGKDSEAFKSALKAGSATSFPGDTVAERKRIAWVIVAALRAHTDLVDKPLQAEAPASKRLAREAILAHPEGAIREGYLVFVVRQKTRRPGLILGPDILAGLADRCTVRQLVQIRDTLVNRISAREGIPTNISQPRNSSQRLKPPKPSGPHDRS